MTGIPKGKALFQNTLSDQHSFFDEVMTILIVSFSFLSTIELLSKHSSPVLEYPSSQLDKMEFPFAAIAENKVYSFKIFQILDKVARQQEITSVDYFAYEKPGFAVTQMPNITYIKNSDTHFFIRKVISGVFSTYYEKIKGRIEQQYNQNPQNWPTELQFARVVRNAFAHNSLINITNPNAIVVNWKHLSYAPANHGKNIFDDFYVVEILDLMIDIDSLI